MYSKTCCIIVIVLFSVKYVVCLENPEVVTGVGRIRGVAATDGDYNMYMGIPYARVDENNPFGDAIPYPPFEDVFEANDDTARCPQVEEFNNTITGSLDCLTLNVYVPNSASSTNPLPVFVWIYGGYFMIGFNGKYLYGPKYLVRHDVIFIVINYRLGPYGFMCLHTPEVPGNQGLKDQVKALRWIRDNIAAFGGDPNKVTIAGNSAGAGAADLHVRSETEQLFDKVIVESGTGLWSITEPDVMYPLKLAKTAGYETNDINEALKYLALLPSDDLIAASNEIGSWLFPCAETKFDGVESFISDYTFNLDVPKAANIKFMVGYNDDETLGTFAAIPPELHFFLGVTFRTLLKRSFNFTEEDLSDMATLVSQFYIGDNEIDSGLIKSISDFVGDILFIHTSEMLIQDAIDNGAATVYRYFFTYVGERNFMKWQTGISDGGAYHADEIGYLFDMQILDEPNEKDQLTIDRITKLWTNFIKYGDPTPTTSELLPVKWLPIGPYGSNYLEIGAQIKTGSTRPYHDRTAFWDLFYEKNKSYLNGYHRDETK